MYVLWQCIINLYWDGGLGAASALVSAPDQINRYFHREYITSTKLYDDTISVYPQRALRWLIISTWDNFVNCTLKCVFNFRLEYTSDSDIVYGPLSNIYFSISCLISASTLKCWIGGGCDGESESFTHKEIVGCLWNAQKSSVDRYVSVPISGQAEGVLLNAELIRQISTPNVKNIHAVKLG